MIYEVNIEDFELQCKVIDCTAKKGDPTSWASPDDYYGYREMDFEVVSGTFCDEEGVMMILEADERDSIYERLKGRIEELLWEQVEADAERWAA